MTTKEAIKHCFSNLKKHNFKKSTDFNTFRVWKWRYNDGQLNESKQEEILEFLGYKCDKVINWQLPEIKI